MRKPQQRKLAHQQAFLKAFENSCCVRSAARAVQIAPKTHYQRLKTDAAYVASFDQSKRAAERAAGEFLEDFDVEPRLGAINDERLLMRLLRRLMPGKYGRC